MKIIVKTYRKASAKEKKCSQTALSIIAIYYSHLPHERETKFPNNVILFFFYANIVLNVLG